MRNVKTTEAVHLASAIVCLNTQCETMVDDPALHVFFGLGDLDKPNALRR